MTANTSTEKTSGTVGGILTRARFILIKEIKSFLGSNLPPVSVAIVAVVCGILSTALNNASGASQLDVTRVLFHAFYILIIITSGFLAMSAFVGERKHGTLELLYTLPVTEIELVLGKFLMGILSVFVLVFGITLVYMIGIAGAPWYMILSGVTGLLLAGLYSYSIGIFASSLTDSYLLSLLITAVILVGIEFGGFMAGLLPSPAKDVFTHMHAFAHFLPFSRGVIPLKGVVFFLSVIVFFLFMTVKVLESRRWRN